MASTRQDYGQSAEALIVGLARSGDRDAFAELVRRRQSWVRNLMRRFSGDATLADDLAQQAFLQAWRKIGSLEQSGRFGAWLKQIAVSIWLQHLRKNDALRNADEVDGIELPQTGNAGAAIDLDRALATLSQPVRLCIVLSYHEGMTHGEIAEATEIPLGTVKSHVRRGTRRLQQLLSAYRETPQTEETA